MEPTLEPGDGLLVVHVQRDFCLGGALEVPDADAVVPALNRWIAAARAAGVPVFASRDWHAPGHVSFVTSGGPWPVHCVQGSPGAAFHRDLALPDDVRIVSNDAPHDVYSSFDGTDLADRLRREGVRRLWVGGLARDICVKATVLDALAAGFEVRLILDATRPVDLEPGDGDRAVAEMERAGAHVEGVHA